MTKRNADGEAPLVWEAAEKVLVRPLRSGCGAIGSGSSRVPPWPRSGTPTRPRSAGCWVTSSG